ncbi:MAG TPA: SDR family oxidoreductase [Stenomitos sp.]
MKVLILGCGYTGQALARCLMQHKVEVQGTNRSGKAIPNLDIPIFTFAYSPEAEMLPLPEAALAGVTHVVSTIAPDTHGIDPIAASLMPLLNLANLQWFGYLSTTGVYGDTQGQWVHEESPLRPQNVRSQHRVAIEATFLHSTLPAHIFRLPGIYGPKRSILERLKSGTAQHIVKPGHVFSRIHVEDIAQTLWHSMRSPNPGTIYNVADDEPSESSTLVVEGARLLGITPPPAIPYTEAVLSPMAASFWDECRRVTNHKIKEELGVKLLYPTYKEGLAAILASESSSLAQS